MLNSLTEESPLFKFIKKPNILISVVLLILIAGCAGKGLRPEPIALNSDPNEQIQIMAIDLVTARSNETHLLSPFWYKEANHSFIAAQKMHSKGEKLNLIFEKLSLAHAQLDKAERLAPIAKIVLVPVSKERAKAIKAGANSYTAGFDTAEKEYLDLTALVENEDRQKAKKKGELVKRLFKQTELIAIQDKALKPARDRLGHAKRIDAEGLAPQALLVAEDSIESAANFIQKNRYASDQIQRRGQTALFLANRVKVLTHEASRIRDNLPETIAMRMEDMNAEIGFNLRLPDLRNLDFATQTAIIIQAIEEDNQEWIALQNLAEQPETMVQTSAESKEQEPYKINSELAEEAERVDDFEKKKKLDELLKSAAKSFSSKEAEIYRQGDNLIFRLKGAGFPSGKSIISSENLSVLAKMTDSMKSFLKAKVIVEGHTDSTGLAKANRQLSERRAKAVSDYLIASGATQREFVQTIGYGHTHPIAPNKTKEGRRLNRRIDIIIKPTPE